MTGHDNGIMICEQLEFCYGGEYSEDTQSPGPFDLIVTIHNARDVVSWRTRTRELTIRPLHDAKEKLVLVSDDIDEIEEKLVELGFKRKVLF